MFYTRDTKRPHAEFIESGLGCGARFTATEKKLTFQNIVKDVIGEDAPETDIIFGNIQESINDLIPVPIEGEDEPDPVPMTLPVISEILSESGCSEIQMQNIKESYENVFVDDEPEASQLVDAKLVEASANRREKAELLTEVSNLKQQLTDTRSLPVTDEDDNDGTAIKTYDVILRVKPEKVPEIHSQIIDGRKCIVIPMGEDEHAAVNGVNTTV
jgi:hypothetical protein